MRRDASRSAAAARQRKWRKAQSAPSITVQLDARDLATLDAIALQLYYEHPHDSALAQHAPGLCPGRPQAIRELCARWRKLNCEDPERELGALHRELAQFYLREASWRRSRGSRHAIRPEPPWAEGVALLERLVRPGIF